MELLPIIFYLVKYGDHACKRTYFSLYFADYSLINAKGKVL